ncbi:hypothetical protein RJ639_033629, partial [Escallonia herrerae]
RNRVFTAFISYENGLVDVAKINRIKKANCNCQDHESQSWLTGPAALASKPEVGSSINTMDGFETSSTAIKGIIPLLYFEEFEKANCSKMRPVKKLDE